MAYLKSVVSVVDVDRIYREFLHSLTDDEDTEDGDVINLIMDQIEFCNLMILNKTDLLTGDQLNEVKEGLRGLQQEAEMIECVNGNVDLEVLLNREDFDFDEVEEYPGALIRSKGYIWFSDDWKHVQLFEQAGRNASITELSEWVSAWPEDELEKVVADFPDIKDDWDETYFAELKGLATAFHLP